MRTLVDKVIAPMFGRINNKGACEACYSHSRVDDLTVPILALNAADDPFTSTHGTNTSLVNIFSILYLGP